MLFGVPVAEEYSLNKEELDEIIKEALNSAKERDIIGKEITPFLLGHVAKVTEGKSLTTSILFIHSFYFNGYYVLLYALNSDV